MLGEKLSNTQTENSGKSDWDSLSEDGDTRIEEYNDAERKKSQAELQNLGRKSMLAAIWQQKIEESEQLSFKHKLEQPESPTLQHKNEVVKFMKNTREQERVERAINGTFLSMEELGAIIDDGAEESTKRTIDYRGKEIEIVNTGNIPFRFLKHSIQYSGARNHPLMDNPSLWDKNEQETKLKNYSNMLSLEYCDSIERRKIEADDRDNTIAYGFLHLPARSLSTISETGQMLHKKRRNIDLPYNMVYKSEELPNYLTQQYFQELQVFRYNEENGEPIMRPDFIIAPTGGITEDTLEQAAYFDVPVFEIPPHEVTSPKTEVEDNTPRAEVEDNTPKTEIDILIDRYLNKAKKDSSPEEISKLEQELRELSSTSSREVWSRKKRSIYPELYDYVLEKSNS